MVCLRWRRMELQQSCQRHLHYYNVAAGYTQGATRIALRYGRQREGLLCVGGVCRYVPQSTGLTLSITSSF